MLSGYPGLPPEKIAYQQQAFGKPVEGMAHEVKKGLSRHIIRPVAVKAFIKSRP